VNTPVNSLPRLAIVLSHPTQYYSPWFRWLRRHTPLEFRVFYLWEFGVTIRHDPKFGTAFRWDVDLLSGYDCEFVPNIARAPGAETFGGFNNPALAMQLSAWRPNALLLFGYKWASHLRAIAWARWHRVPLLFRGDSHLLGRGLPPAATRLVLRTLFRQFAAVTYVGAANRDYFTALGVPGDRLFFAPHSVDHELFNAATSPAREATAALRSQLGLAPATSVVLFAGKFVASKQPRELLEAFLALARTDTALVFVGDGPEKNALVALAAAAPTGRVHFLPFANQTEMPVRYLLASLFVLPSRGHYETWGLAVNEAMHLGVPTLVSDLVGCQRDLVTDGETGWVFRANDSHAIREKLATALAALADPAARQRIRGNVAARIAGYTYQQTTDGLLAALASVPARKSA
jgi:glycosyltransferase involved in cell wall biosynthesis